MELKHQIRIARKDKGYNQKELAKVLNVTPASVSNWERGYSYPEMETLKQISKLLDYEFTIKN